MTDSKNRLADSLSPYLQQHADNPVHWQPWDDAALAQARREDKPILLSVGYAACHWCHVMAHESFVDSETAEVMNKHFVNIKVDREERPDLDRIYQAAHFVFARRGGGWPLTMFLAPDGAPFFGGTYFPKHEGRGLPSFVSVLETVAGAWRERRKDIEKQNAEVLPVLQSLDSYPDAANNISAAPVAEAVRLFCEMTDRVNGGFRGAPKFPHPAEMEFCMQSQNPEAAACARLSLEKMAAGGLCDHLGGGFFRYCVDERWSVPHFEKMLSDNGLLLALFADGARMFDSDECAQAAEGIAKWVLAEMRNEDGSFYSSLDADSEGGEGKFYAWDLSEIESALSDKEFAAMQSHFGLAAGANFEGRHHLCRRQTVSQTASALQLSVEECAQTLASAKQKLFAKRDDRTRPATDDKILAAWNGLMIRGLARAGRVLEHPEWTEAAVRALLFIRDHMCKEGRLYCARRNTQLGHVAFLDDCAFLLDASLELLRGGFRADVWNFALDMASQLREHFEDNDSGGFYFTPADGETLIRRPKSADDNAVPCGNGVAARALFVLSWLSADLQWSDAADKTVKIFYGAVKDRPAGCASLLGALQMHLSPPSLVLLTGDPAQCAEWQKEIETKTNAQTFIIPPDASGLPPSLQKPAPETGAQGYICARFSCRPPESSLQSILQVLSDIEV